MYFYNPLPQHLLEVDPHPQYLTPTEGDAVYAPLSVARGDGLTVEVFPRLHAVSSRTWVSGEANFSFFTPAYDATVSKIRVASATPAGSGLTMARLGLYTVSGNNVTLVARTANDTTVFTSTFTQYTRFFDTAGGFPATYNLIRGQRYALGIIVVGSTMPNVYGNGFTLGSLNALPPRQSAVITGQTDLPSTATVSTGLNFIYWGWME
jgi:hypothetical protein